MPIFLLILFDLIGWICMAFEIAVPAAFAVLASNAVFGAFGWWGILLASPLLLVGMLLSFCAAVFFLRTLAPTLREGEYPFPNHPMSRAWSVHLQIARLAQMTGIRPFFMGTTTARFFLLRALGAKAAFRINTSSDLYVYDASMVEIGPGVLVGGTSGIVGHYVEGGKLTLKKTIVGAGSQLGTGILLGPGTRLGEKVSVSSFSRFAANIEVGERTHIGYDVMIEPHCAIGKRVIIGNRVTLQSHCEIGDRAVIESGVTLAKGTKVPAGERVTSSP